MFDLLPVNCFEYALLQIAREIEYLLHRPYGKTFGLGGLTQTLIKADKIETFRLIPCPDNSSGQLQRVCST
jgi:hypothetical protein